MFLLINLKLSGMFLFLSISIVKRPQHVLIFSIVIFVLFRADLSQFEYLTMAIKESLRLFPPIAVVLRQLDQPMTLRSKLLKMTKFVLPKKSPISVNLYTLGRNPHVWDNPQVSLNIIK